MGDATEGVGETGSEQLLDFRHTHRLIIVLVVVIALIAVARWLAVPDDFGEFGYYRAGAVTDAREGTPDHIGEAACAECHDEEVALHDKDVHVRVPCESCHGPGAAHAAAEGEAPMRKPGSRDDCLVCHRKLIARPGAFPQINWKEHYAFVGVKDESTQCTACHNPHEPLFMDRDVRTARLHPLIHRCRDCHQGRDDETMKRPPDHQPIFTCDYCHKDIVADFAKRPHHELRCTACHIFVKETDTAGRIIRDADPRFCLLCHREADFRSDDAPPSISWPDHLDDVAFDDEDKAKRCIDCHQDRIHQLRGVAK